jgi:hypothetical protein
VCSCQRGKEDAHITSGHLGGSNLLVGEIKVLALNAVGKHFCSTASKLQKAQEKEEEEEGGSFQRVPGL